MRHRRRSVNFDCATPAVVPRFLLSSDAKIDGLHLVVWIAGQKTEWNFERYSRRELALDFLSVFHKMVVVQKHFSNFNTFIGYRLAIGGILSNIDELDPENRIHCLRDIDRRFLDCIDIGSSQANYKRLQALIVVLRASRESDVDTVSEDLETPHHGDRLSYISSAPKPRSNPKDAYSPYVANQILGAARGEIQAAITRVRAGIANLQQVKLRSSERAPNVGEAVLLDIADGEAFEKVNSKYIFQLKEEGFDLAAPINPIDLSAYDPEIIQNVARDIVVNGKITPNNHPICLSELQRIKRFSPEFSDMMISEGKILLKETIREVLVRRDNDKNLIEISTPPSRNNINLKDSDLIEIQLERRLYVLRAWLEQGIPSHKKAWINFDMKGVSSWEDPDYGIDVIPILTGKRNSIYNRYSEIIDNIRTLIDDLSIKHLKRPKSAHFTNLIAKIQVLEEWVVSGAPSSYASCSFELRFLVDWVDEELGLAPLNRHQSVRTHPCYGPYVQWAFQLLQALKVQFQTRGLVSWPTARPARGYKSATDIVSSIGPSQDELTSFLAGLGLMCQIDLGSLKNLTRNCLENAANGFVDISYRKIRRKNRRRNERVRDGSIETPGGLIRVVLELTEPASRALQAAGHPDANALWLGVFRRQGFQKCNFQHPVRHPWWRFCERNTILGDDGQRLDAIHPGKFRKTVKAIKYRKAGGDLFAISDDHSHAVARDHYANLPSLAEIHDEAVTRGLQQALADISVRVVTGNAPISVDVERLSRATGIQSQRCLDVIEGREDTWLAGCLSFKSSPFSAEGSPCQTSFSECLHCSNSVYTFRKLPNLLRYREFIKSRRLLVSDQEWIAQYAPDLERLERQILPCFSDEQLERARRTIDGDEDTDPLFIPSTIKKAI